MEALFTVDNDKCTRCGLCAMACPVALVVLKDKESLPAPARGAGEICIRCGHCVAACPEGALDHAAMAAADCPPLNRDLLPGPEAVELLFRSRRSCRNYTSKPVPRELVQRLIETARYAPTGHNMQNVRWLAVTNPEETKRLAGITVDWMRAAVKSQPEFAAAMHLDRVIMAWGLGFDAVLRGAPCLVAAHAPQEDPTAPTSATIALAYLELAAGGLGLAGCWAGFFQAAARFWPPMAEALALPPGHVSNGAMMLGFPKFRYSRLPKRNAPEILWR
jgi:nitroreductase/NAD-dependent dihydropyrimidine dehydrogenase PreA subunit